MKSIIKKSVLGLLGGLLLLLPLLLGGKDIVSVETRFIKVPAIVGVPAQFDKVSVNIYRSGKSSKLAKVRLVLVSGWTCGAGWFDSMARFLSAQYGLEVWTLNRRQTMFEKRKLFNEFAKQFEQGKLSYRDFYKKIKKKTNFLHGLLCQVGKIGLKESIVDMHAVVKKATQDGYSVLLGGWSDGVEYVMAYTLTAFSKGKTMRRGHSFLKGLVLIDENPEWGRISRRRMAQLAKQTELKIAGGNFCEKRYPNTLVFESAALFGAKVNPIAKFFYRRPYRYKKMSGEALLGWLYDGGGWRSSWSWLFSCGSFKHSRTLVGWGSGDLTPIDRVVGMHKAPGGMWEWFYPNKIAADYWKLGAAGFKLPAFSVAPDRSNKLPIFTVFSSMNRSWRKIPAGLRYYLRRTGIADKQVAVLKKYRYKHGDILLSPKAEKDIWAPLAVWIEKKLKR